MSNVSLPSIEEVNKWSPDHVVIFLKSKKDKLFIRDQDIEKIENNWVSGRAFVNLSLDELLASPYNLSGGPAKVISELIKEIRNEERADIPLKQKYDSIFTSSTGEGLDTLGFISDERLDKIDKFMTSKWVALLRSPPESGKTTLASLFKEYLKKKGYHVVNISMLDLNGTRNWGMDNCESFDIYWMELVGKKWTELMNYKTQIDVIIDEAQILYDEKMKFFWNVMKRQLQECSRNINLRILLLSMYDDSPGMSSSTPIYFDEALGLNDLRLLRLEFEKIVDEFVKGMNNLTMIIPTVLRDVIFNMTYGHPGLVRHTLRFLYLNYRNSFSDVSELLNYLLSPRYFKSIKSTRSFIWLDKLREQMTTDDVDFLRLAFDTIDSTSVFNVNLDDLKCESIVSRYRRSGLVTQASKINDDQLQFAAPLVRIILGQLLYTAPLGLVRSENNNFDMFLILSIERMRPSILCNSLSRDITKNAFLIERQWQNEWYRAAMTAVPKGTFINPDVGPVFGSSGFIDYYINSNYHWGIEILREGQDMKEHYERFSRNGKYYSLPLNRWAIIDFRHISKRVKTLRENFWHVCYVDDFSTVTIQRFNEIDIRLSLRGDVLYPTYATTTDKV